MKIRVNENSKYKNNSFKAISKLCKILIVGLGNPDYDRTRHNIGADTLKQIIKNKKTIPITKNLSLVFFDGFLAFTLIAPDFMNISGKKITETYHKLECTKLIILHDDLDTSLGNIKKKFGGSSGGHNGIKSIIEHIGYDNFYRIKIGISRPENKDDVSDYVLSKFPPEEFQKLIEKTQEIENLILDIQK